MAMRVLQATNETCGTSAGTVVVIDVIRAFTTAAFAFAAGARDILLVSTVEEALALRERFPGALVMGEVGGLPPPGFDLGNSPSELIGRDLSGRRLIQRTGAGTQGIVRSLCAETLLASSFVCAGATARHIMQQAPDSVTFVVSGDGPGGDGDEDAACTDYLTALLRGGTPDAAPFLRRVRESRPGGLLTAPEIPKSFAADLDCCTELDRFDFVMLVQRRDGLLVMKAAS